MKRRKMREREDKTLACLKGWIDLEKMGKDLCSFLFKATLTDLLTLHSHINFLFHSIKLW